MLKVLMVCAGIVIITALLCIGEAPPEAAASSRLLDVWIEFWNGTGWVPISINGPQIWVQDTDLFEGIPKLIYMYRMHPPIEVRYRVLLKNLSEMRLGVLLAIDGYNTVNSRPIVGDCTDHFWVLDPYQTAVIGGWQATTEEGLGFYFSAGGKEPHVPGGPLVGTIRLYIFVAEESRDTLLRLFSAIARAEPEVFLDAAADFALAAREGSIVIYTGAGEIISQPITTTYFSPLICSPIEEIWISYAAEYEPWLGIVCKTAEYFGVKVLYVIPWSPAAEAGIKSGDIISKADGKLLYSAEQLKQIILSKRPGDVIELLVHGEWEARRVVLGKW
ncbi:hypothetical protein DRO49_06385 [Candidatus Bathyarchaeota archaeon]|nr:MAG: hypothetical protein DRO49_06385 [Candidatus Bathyarchaeota archaeon]